MTAAARLGIVAGDGLGAALRSGRLGEFEALSPAAACLMPLLAALDWRGEQERLIEALPHFANRLEVIELRNCLAELGYPTHPLRLSRLSALDPRFLPCLFVPRAGEPVILLETVPGGIRAFDGEARAERTLYRDPAGTAYVIDAQAETAREGDFTMRLKRRFKRTFAQLLLVTGMLDLLAFAVPLGSMLIYDRVLAPRSDQMLLPLAIGLSFVLLCDMALRLVRSRLVAYAAARIEYLVGVAALRQIMRLPLMLIEASSVGAQMARLREFDALREFFTAPLAVVALELPFTILLLAGMAVLAGPLVLVPIGFVALFIMIALFLLPAQRRAGAATSRARADRHAFLVEMLGCLDTIKEAAAEAVWLDRYRDISARAAAANRRNQLLAAVTQSLGNALMLAAGAATIGAGTLLILDGALTVGMLVAAMALAWRILSPLQLGLTMLSRIDVVQRSAVQLNALMRVLPEGDTQAPAKMARRVFAGHLRVRRATLRYRAEHEPALLGVDLEARPGELVAVVGANGSGKSSLLKVAAGLHQPQAGAVSVDGIDIRQLDPAELRRTLAYLPQRPRLFYGTIAQNLRLAAPTSTDAELERALADAGALEEVFALPDGIATRLADESGQRLPSGLVQRVSLASMYLRGAPVLMLDDPGQSLDEQGDRDFMAMLERFKGKKTMILVTNRPSHMRLADRVVTLAAGREAPSSPARELQRRVQASVA